MLGLRLHLSLHTAVRELLCWPREILCTFSLNGSRGTIKPLWAVLASQSSKSAGSSVSPPAGNGCVFKRSLPNCDQIPQGHSLQNAFHHPKCDVTQRFLTKLSGGWSVK